MNHILATTLFSAFVFTGMLGLQELGRRVGKRRQAVDPEGGSAGLGAVDGAVFALLGLLIAFTFSGAASRFHERRALIVEETNDIGTAWLRLNLLPATTQPGLREAFRRYVDARLEVYRNVSDTAATQEALARSNALQSEIWNRAVAATLEGAAPSAPMLLLPALNEMFDITTTRAAALRIHPPKIIFALLALVAFTSSLLAGYGMAPAKTRSWIHMVSFAAIIAGAVFVILDVEYPRLGLIRVDGFDRVLMDLRESMK